MLADSTFKIFKACGGTKLQNSKIYLVAYACEPGQGSEHEIGWRTAVSLSDKSPLTVITRESNRKLIEQHQQNTRINFIFLEATLFRFLKPRGKFSYLYYILWQFTVFLYLRCRVRSKDIVHYITFGNIHLPTFLHFIKCRLFIGPMGGGATINYRLIRNPKFRTIIRSVIHDAVNSISKYNFFIWLLCKRSECIYLRTEESIKLIPDSQRWKVKVFLETGVVSQDIITRSGTRRLKQVISVSRLIESKNIDQVIETFKKLQKLSPDMLTLDIVGDGPMLDELSTRYSSENIQFRGKVGHSDVLNLLKKADLYLSCSIKEGGSHSLFESAIADCPIACYDVSGMKQFPSNGSGIKITPSHNIDANTSMLAQEIYFNFENHLVKEICEKNRLDVASNYSWDFIGHRYFSDYSKGNL